MAEEEDAAKRAATEMVVSAEYIPRRKALVAALTTELKELVAECRRLMRSSSRNYQCLWLDDAGRWRVRDAEEMVPQDIPEPWIHLSIQMRKVWDISQWMKKVAETSEAWIIRVTTLNAIMHHSLPPQQITALFSTIYNFPFVWSDVAHFWRTTHQGNIPTAITDLFQGKDEDRHPPQHQHQPRHTSSEELPNAADGVGGDGEGEEEEEEDEAECGVCHGDKDYKHWICCDDCNVWYHLRCVGITLKESRRMDRLNLLYHCSHCSNPTSSSSAP